MGAILSPVIFTLGPGTTAPEDHGIIGVGKDAAAIQAAINAIQAAGGGMVVLSQSYTLEAGLTVATGAPVTFFGTGAGNRQVFQDTFTGGYLRPSNSFPSNTPLISLGTSGAPTTNPNGTTFWGVCMSGLQPNGTNTTGCTGIAITDTSDVHLIGCFLADFDRPGTTGTCVSLTSSGAGNCLGFESHSSIFSASWRGVYGDTAGVTDIRIIGGLFHSNTQGCTFGATAGGGGVQIYSAHFVYAGVASAAYALKLGSQAGDYNIQGCYFDKNGNNVAVQLANAKGLFCNNHFLVDSTLSSQPVNITTASLETVFCNNHCNSNGSSMTALLKTTASSGAPSNGVYTGNNVYGTPASLVSTLIDSANSAIPATNTSSTYVAGNVSGT